VLGLGLLPCWLCPTLARPLAQLGRGLGFSFVVCCLGRVCLDCLWAMRPRLLHRLLRCVPGLWVHRGVSWLGSCLVVYCQFSPSFVSRVCLSVRVGCPCLRVLFVCSLLSVFLCICCCYLYFWCFSCLWMLGFVLTYHPTLVLGCLSQPI
jgi:hypothetical protein